MSQNTYTFTVEIDEYKRYYYLKDHLGNIRVTLDKFENVVSAQDYYAFGEVLRSYNAGDVNNKYKFTEKERDVETSYDYFGARFYDGRIGRWLSVDPLADKYPGWSPYNYVLNNPLKFIDPDEMRVDVYAQDDESKKLITSSLTPADAKYIKFDDNGKIDKNLINQSKSKDGNFEALKTLVNSNNVYEVLTNKKGFNFKDETGKDDFHGWGQVDSEGGFGGYALSPGAGSKWNSTNKNFQVIINSNNTNSLQFKYSMGYFLAHELYGHAYLHSKGEYWEHDTELQGKDRKLNDIINERQLNTERNQRLWEK